MLYAPAASCTSLYTVEVTSDLSRNDSDKNRRKRRKQRLSEEFPWAKGSSQYSLHGEHRRAMRSAASTCVFSVGSEADWLHRSAPRRPDRVFGEGAEHC